MMAKIPAAINRYVAWLAPEMPAEGRNIISGTIKLVERGVINGGWSLKATDAGHILTAGEQSALFRSARRFVVKWGTRFFLVGALASFVRRLVAGGEENTLETRLEIISAHIVKPGPLWSKALGVAEQLALLIFEDIGTVAADVVAAVIPPWDIEGALARELASVNAGREHAEGLGIASDLNAVDTIIEAPGFLVQPVFTPVPNQGAITFPAGPRPSFGARR